MPEINITCTTAPDGTTTTAVSINHPDTVAPAAAPAAAPAGIPTFANGCMGFFGKFKMKAGFDAKKWRENGNKYTAAGAALGAMCLMNLEDEVVIGLFPSSEAWLTLNAQMQASPSMGPTMGMVESCQAFCFGDISPEASAAIKMWDSMPGWSCKETPLAGGKLTSAPFTPSTVGYIGFATAKSEAAMDGMMATFADSIHLALAYTEQCPIVRTGPTTMIWIHQYADEATWLNVNDKWGQVPNFMERFVGGMETLKGYCWGPPLSEAGVAALAGWDGAPGFDVKQYVPTSQFGADGVMGFVNLQTHASKEAMEKAMKIGATWGEEIGKANGAVSMVNCVTGENTSIFACILPSNSCWPGMNAGFGAKIMGDPEMQALFAGTKTECLRYGQITQESYASMAGWSDSPGFTFMAPATHVQTGALPTGKGGMQGLNEIVYKDPAWKESAAAQKCDAELQAIMEKHDIFTAQWEEAMSMKWFWSWVDSDKWVAFNKDIMTSKSFMDSMGSIAFMKITHWGPMSADAKAALEGWKANPAFVFVEGKMNGDSYC